MKATKGINAPVRPHSLAMREFELQPPGALPVSQNVVVVPLRAQFSVTQINHVQLEIDPDILLLATDIP